MVVLLVVLGLDLDFRLENVMQRLLLQRRTCAARRRTCNTRSDRIDLDRQGQKQRFCYEKRVEEQRDGGGGGHQNGSNGGGEVGAGGEV